MPKVVGPQRLRQVRPASNRLELAVQELPVAQRAPLRRGEHEALRVANDSPYGLTGGVYSKNRDHLERARREFKAGNVYFNRSITGALAPRDSRILRARSTPFMPGIW